MGNFKFVLVLIAFSLPSIHLRCFGERNCRCLSSLNLVSCHGIIRVPDIPLGTYVETLDLKRSRLVNISQLTTLNSWPNLKVVDIRDQQTIFKCDRRPTFAFRVLSDCEFAETTTEGYDTTVASPTPDYGRIAGLQTIIWNTFADITHVFGFNRKIG